MLAFVANACSAPVMRDAAAAGVAGMGPVALVADSNDAGAPPSRLDPAAALESSCCCSSISRSWFCEGLSMSDRDGRGFVKERNVPAKVGAGGGPCAANNRPRSERPGNDDVIPASEGAPVPPLLAAGGGAGAGWGDRNATITSDAVGGLTVARRKSGSPIAEPRSRFCCSCCKSGPCSEIRGFFRDDESLLLPSRVCSFPWLIWAVLNSCVSVGLDFRVLSRP